jgi:hypothetical protein
MSIFDRNISENPLEYKDNPAYKYLKNYVLKYIKTNNAFDKYGISKEDLLYIKNDRNSILEWVLEECINPVEYIKGNDNGILIVCDWGVEAENAFTSIYKMGRRYVKINHISSETIPWKGTYEYSFVKKVKKKVIVYEYE